MKLYALELSGDRLKTGLYRNAMDPLVFDRPGNVTDAGSFAINAKIALLGMDSLCQDADSGFVWVHPTYLSPKQVDDYISAAGKEGAMIKRISTNR